MVESAGMTGTQFRLISYVVRWLVATSVGRIIWEKDNNTEVWVGWGGKGGGGGISFGK